MHQNQIVQELSGMDHTVSHTTNRVDVILGAKLFNHLLALPLKCFEIRRVGDTVARVRELENIRQFLTRSTITVMLDLFFCIVFIMAMFSYSVTLKLNHKFACGAGKHGDRDIVLKN